MPKLTFTNFGALAIFIIAIFVLFWQLGNNHLTNWDEAWYAAIARTMSEASNWLTPIWNTQPFLEKPPLFFWVTALIFKLFGVSEFNARIVSATSGLGSIILVFFLGNLFWRKIGGLFSAIVLSSTIGFLYRARTGNMDALLTFFITLSMLAYFYWLKKQDSQWLIVFGLALAAGFLTKGIQVFIFPFLVAVYLGLTNFKMLLKFSRGILAGLVIILGWMIISYTLNGKAFLDQFLTQQVDKMLGNNSLLANFSFDYLIYLKSGLKIWFLFLIPAIFYALFRLRNQEVLILIYFLLFLGLLSFAENKGNWYLLPLYPAAAMIIGYFITKISALQLYNKPPLLLLIVAIGLVQLFLFRGEFIVPDVAGDEARVALAAAKFTDTQTPLYLTHYYAPTTVFYSQRLVYAVYSDEESNGGWWIKPKSTWATILAKSNTYFITTTSELKELEFRYPEVGFVKLFQSGQKLLLKTL